VQEPNEIAAHLGSLATELRGRGLDARVVARGAQPYVKVANPDTPELNERVLCRHADDDSLCFWWPWRQPIGSVDDLETVADKITAVLRSVESQP
jgi:hypothetical protein